jgi:hypothetical protein
MRSRRTKAKMGIAQLDLQKPAPKKASSSTGPLECGALLAMKLAILAACSRVVPMTLGTAPKSDDAARVHRESDLQRVAEAAPIAVAVLTFVLTAAPVARSHAHIASAQAIALSA